MLSLDIATEVGKWVASSIEAYIRGNIRESSVSVAPDWNDKDIVHASQLDECPKRVALKNQNMLNDPRTMFDELRMAEGRMMGELIVRALQWGLVNHEASGEWEPLRIIPENHNQYGNLVGNIDVLVQGLSGNGETTWTPVEFKLTDAWRYEGISPSHFKQTSAYISLLQGTSRYCRNGLVFTLYDKVEAGVWYKFWPITAEHGGYRLWMQDGTPAAFTSPMFTPYYTTLGTYLSDVSVEGLVATRMRYLRLTPEELVNSVAPYHLFQHYECGKVVPPEYYVKAYTTADGRRYAAGDKKPNTGTYTVRCPHANQCFAAQLVDAGFETSKIGKGASLPIGNDAYGGYVLESKDVF